jgi:hypothetical protein
MRRFFYGFEHFHGRGMTNTDGDSVGLVHVFLSRQDRDNWVDDPPWLNSGQRVHRDVLMSNDTRVRRLWKELDEDEYLLLRYRARTCPNYELSEVFGHAVSVHVHVP